MLAMIEYGTSVSVRVAETRIAEEILLESRTDEATIDVTVACR